MLIKKLVARGQMNNRRLIFVYNADSSLEHKVFDFLHKAISPATYQCSLCAITYGTFSMHKEWKDFISSLSVPVEFLYKNEFKRYYKGYSGGYPAVLMLKDKELELLIGPEEMKNLELEGLKKQLQQKILK